MEKQKLNPKDARCEKKKILDLSKWLNTHPTARAALDQSQLDHNFAGFSHDMNAYNNKGTRCVRVLDDEGSSEGYHFFIIGAQKIGDRWITTYVSQCGHCDGIDAMDEANNWLNIEEK